MSPFCLAALHKKPAFKTDILFLMQTTTKDDNREHEHKHNTR